MIITCEQCQARFRLADEKLKPGGTKVRCSKCKHVFLVLPPEAPAAEEAVDFGTFNMERVADEETAPVPPAPQAPPPEQQSVATTAATAPPAGDLDLDFSGLEQSMGPGGEENRFEEEFSFADTTPPAVPPLTDEPAAAETAGADEFPGGLDFDATFAETETPTSAVPTAEEPAGFVFDVETPASEPGKPAEETAAFSFESEPAAPAAETFGFEEKPADSATSEFSFAADADHQDLAFGEEPPAPDEPASFSFDTQEPSAATPFTADAAFGDDGANPWDKPETAEGPSFDFDEPSFETQTEEKPPKRGDEAGLSFGEIDFSGEGGGETPSFGEEPDFSQATLARPAAAEAAPAPSSSPPRPAVSRPRGEAPLPAPTLPRKTPMSRVLLWLVLLLLILCGAGGYFIFMGNGRQVVENLLLKVKGEEPAVPVEQRIGLNIVGSSYIDNRDAGQLLIIQGAATNNFTGARSAITVKGLILDAGGKVIQQQTVFCGNFLSEEKLKTMKYAQIEEAMNNQFGDSLVNMNVKPGGEIRFTIVFRNVPKEMANINVEVVDSKPGGM